MKEYQLNDYLSYGNPRFFSHFSPPEYRMYGNDGVWWRNQAGKKSSEVWCPCCESINTAVSDMPAFMPVSSSVYSSFIDDTSRYCISKTPIESQCGSIWDVCFVLRHPFELNRESMPHARIVRSCSDSALYDKELKHDFYELTDLNVRGLIGTDRHVYFIEAVGDNRIKIGISSNTGQRLKSLSTASHADELKLLLQMPGTEKDEAELHKRFSQYRVKGKEWFHAGEELRGYIADEKDKASKKWNSINAVYRLNQLLFKAMFGLYVETQNPPYQIPCSMQINRINGGFTTIEKESGGDNKFRTIANRLAASIWYTGSPTSMNPSTKLYHSALAEGLMIHGGFESCKDIAPTTEIMELRELLVPEIVALFFGEVSNRSYPIFIPTFIDVSNIGNGFRFTSSRQDAIKMVRIVSNRLSFGISKIKNDSDLLELSKELREDPQTG